MSRWATFLLLRGSKRMDIPRVQDEERRHVNVNSEKKKRKEN